MCSYGSPSPEPDAPKDALETVSNDSLVSYSPPALSPVPVEPYAPVKPAPPEAKGGGRDEMKKHVRRRRSKDKEHRRRRKSRESPSDGHSSRKKRRRHQQQGSGSPHGHRTRKGSTKRPKKHHQRSSVSSKDKVVPRSYRSPTPDKFHHRRSPSSERGYWQREPAYDDISSPGSPYPPPCRRRSSYNSYNVRSPHSRRTPSPRGRYPYTHSPHRHRSPSPYYCSPGRRSPSPRTSISPPYKRYRGPPSPLRRRISPRSMRRRRGRGYSPPPREGYRRTSSPDERVRWIHRSRSPVYSPPRSRGVTGGEGGKLRRDASIEDRKRDAKLTKRGTILWNKSGDEESSKRPDIEDTDSGEPPVAPAPPPAEEKTLPTQQKEQVSTSQPEPATEAEASEVPPQDKTADERQDQVSSKVVQEAPPLPSDAPPPPPPPEEVEKPPLPPVPSLPLFVPPPAMQGDSKAPLDSSSNTPLDHSTDKSQSGSPRKPSVSPISLGSSPTPFSRPLLTQTAAVATPELPQEPLQPREHKPRCIDAFEIIDQIGEGTYGKVSQGLGLRWEVAIGVSHNHTRPCCLYGNVMCY